jgi:hypothetical protein
MAISAPKLSIDSAQISESTAALVYKSFIIVLRRNIQLCDRKLSTALSKFVLEYKQCGTKYVTRLQCYNRITDAAGDEKYVFPRASAPKLIKYGIAKLFQICYIYDNISYNKWFITRRLPCFDSVFVDTTENQNIIVNYIVQNYLNINKLNNPANSAMGKIGGCVCQAGAGTGKTRIGLAAIHKLGLRSLVVVPNNKICMYQWANEYKIAYKSRESSSSAANDSPRLTLVGDGHKDFSGDIVIATAASLLNKPPMELDKFLFLVIDECHSFCTQTISQIFWVYQCVLTLGLTATPADRADGFDKDMLPLHIGEIVIAQNIPGYNLEYASAVSGYNVEVRAIKYYGPPEYTKPVINDSGQIRVPELISQILRDPYRNTLILKLIQSLLGQGANIFVFSDRRAHCRWLQERLCEMSTGAEEYVVKDRVDDDIAEDDTDDAPNNFYIFVQGVTHHDLNGAAASKHGNGTVIFTTYMYSRQAINIQNMDTEILCAPRRNLTTQVVGRICRYGSDVNVKRRVIDIIDMCTSLKSQYDGGRKPADGIIRNRKASYAAAKYTVIEKETKWELFTADVEARKLKAAQKI